LATAQLPVAELPEHPAVAAGDQHRDPLGGKTLRVDLHLVQRLAVEQHLHLPDQGVGAEGTRIWRAGVMAEHHDGVEGATVRLRHRRVGLCQCQVGDRAHIDTRRHAVPFDVGADHVPIADRDPLCPGIAQGLDRDQDLVGHQPAAASVGGGVGG
jgi:hypothetical protein